MIGIGFYLKLKYFALCRGFVVGVFFVSYGFDFSDKVVSVYADNEVFNVLILDVADRNIFNRRYDSRPSVVFILLFDCENFLFNYVLLLSLTVNDRLKFFDKFFKIC